VLYGDVDLENLNEEGLRDYRGNVIGIVFQEPMNSLIPTVKIWKQMAEAIEVGRKRQGKKKGIGNSFSDFMRRRLPPRHDNGGSTSKEESVEWLRRVGIADADNVAERYPFELSGGMAQRVMIAMALSQAPALLLADEPTTALDVTTQAQILRLMNELMKQINTTILLITHDMGLAAQVSDRVVVMYSGTVVEEAGTNELFLAPLHPYTQSLLKAIPTGHKSETKLGIRASPTATKPLTGGCKFADRCPYVMDRCNKEIPRYYKKTERHYVKCFLYE
jgi:oligopeptide/dipeptide ABC transporter ATP-binding protein